MRRLIQVSIATIVVTRFGTVEPCHLRELGLHSRVSNTVKVNIFARRNFCDLRDFDIVRNCNFAASTVIIRQLAKGYFCEFLFLCFLSLLAKLVKIKSPVKMSTYTVVIGATIWRKSLLLLVRANWWLFIAVKVNFKKKKRVLKMLKMTLESMM